MMMRWWEHGEKGVTDRQTDRRMDGQTDGLNQSYSCLVAAKNVWFPYGTHLNVFIVWANRSAPNKRQDITPNNDYPFHRRIYTSLDLNGLTI